MDARALLGVGFAALWSWTCTVTAKKEAGMLPLVLWLAQFCVWVSACSLLSASSNVLVAYAEYVLGLWTFFVAAVQFVFKAHPESHSTLKVPPAPLVLDCWTMRPRDDRYGELEEGFANVSTEAPQSRGCADVVFAVREAVEHPEPSQRDIEIPGIRQLLHISWFAVLIAWALAGIAVLGTSAPALAAALMLGGSDWVLRADLNVESEQTGIVRATCLAGLQITSGVLRISPLQTIAVCLCTISIGIWVWNGDAASVAAYVCTTVVLPWVLSALYRSDPVVHAKSGCMARFECVVASWLEQRALTESGWWVWFALTELVDWEPSLQPNFSTPLGAEAFAALNAFAGFAIILFSLSIMAYARESQLAVACLRSNTS